MSATNPQARRETLEMYGRFRAIILPIMLVAFGLVLIMVQPDFGSFVVITVITVGMLFLAGLPWKYFCPGRQRLGWDGADDYRRSLPCAAGSGILDPWKDPQAFGYQLTHSLMAIGRGEWFGMGLGASLSKRGFLPEAHTDFILPSSLKNSASSGCAC